jgi:hypothetical protein
MMTDSHTHNLPDLFDAVTELGTGVFIGATIAPGFLLCIPGITLAALVILAPVLALALVALAGAVVMMPFLLLGFALKRWSARIKVTTPIATAALSRLDPVNDTVFGLAQDGRQAALPGAAGLIAPLVK